MIGRRSMTRSSRVFAGGGGARAERGSEGDAPRPGPVRCSLHRRLALPESSRTHRADGSPWLVLSTPRPAGFTRLDSSLSGRARGARHPARRNAGWGGLGDSTRPSLLVVL